MGKKRYRNMPEEEKKRLKEYQKKIIARLKCLNIIIDEIIF